MSETSVVANSDNDDEDDDDLGLEDNFDSEDNNSEITKNCELTKNEKILGKRGRENEEEKTSLLDKKQKLSSDNE